MSQRGSRVLRVRISAASSVLAMLAICALDVARAGAQETTPQAAPGIETGAAPAADGASADSSAPDSSALSAEHPETLLDFALAGGWLMVPIGVLSVLWLAFLAERLVATRRSRVLPRPLVGGLRELAARGPIDVEKVETLCVAHPSSAARIVEAAALRLDHPRDEVEEAVDNVAQREAHGLRRYIGLFAVIAGVSPLIGLLGTVTGMIQAFREVALQGLGSGQELAPGIYKALVTTAAGLSVAIPALVTYHWLQSRVTNYLHELDNLVVDFVEASRSSQAPAARRAGLTV